MSNLLSRIWKSRPASVGRVRELRREMRKISETLRVIQTTLHEEPAEIFERSRSRWRTVNPDAGLTWGEYLNGDEFISACAGYGLFGPDKRLVEIGPGYGRLIDSMLGLEQPFGSYVGLDISEGNVEFLADKYSANNRIQFLHADAETADFGPKADSLFSSATMHHFYPSNRKVITNIASNLSEGGLLIFDVPEGDRAFFEEDGQTFIRWYTPESISNTLVSSGFDVVATDPVVHKGERDHKRLLVVGRRQVDDRPFDSRFLP